MPLIQCQLDCSISSRGLLDIQKIQQLVFVINTSEEVTLARQTGIKRFTTLMWGNNDYSEETLSGKGSTPVVNGIVIQR